MKRPPLALLDDLWHPGVIPRVGLKSIDGFEWLENGREWSEDVLAGRAGVVLAKANNVSVADKEPWADDETGAAFTRYVESGGGLLVVHSGASGYQDLPAMRGLPAGAFAHHPPQCPVTVEPVEGHLLCEGVTPFTETDEHYFMHFDDPAADVFLHTRSEHGEQPAGWTRMVGSGRVCVLTPGHTLSMWMHPSFQRLLGNCWRWVTAGSR